MVTRGTAAVGTTRVLDKVPKIPNARVVREYVDQPLDAELNEIVTHQIGVSGIYGLWRLSRHGRTELLAAGS